MTAFEKKMKYLADRHGWKMEKQPRAAVPSYIITAASYSDACKIVAVLKRSKTLNIKTVSPLASSYTNWTVCVHDAAQFRAWLEREHQKSKLVEVFYKALKANGGDQNAAKATQYETAVQWNAIEAFNAIYA